MKVEIPGGPDSSAHDARRAWMGTLAKAQPTHVESLCDGLRPLPSFEWLRRPETGLVMVRGRIGGTGAKFNVGEMSITRCALRIAGGATGFGYVQGRNARHAELAALVDALMQDPEARDRVESAVIEPLARAQREARSLTTRKAAATRVDFYTLVRGENT